MPNTDISYYPDAIVTRSRGLLETLSCGRWGSQTIIDFARRTVAVNSAWPRRRSNLIHRFREFCGVDFSYKEISSGIYKGFECESGEFSVGLCFTERCEVLPVASFKGFTTTPVGLTALFARAFPRSWSEPDRGYEISSRALVQTLRQKMGMPIAI